MGACVSHDNDGVEQKKKSQAIDKILEEDSKRLRKECKILLLGKQLLRPRPHPPSPASSLPLRLLTCARAL